MKHICVSTGLMYSQIVVHITSEREVFFAPFRLGDDHLITENTFQGTEVYLEPWF